MSVVTYLELLYGAAKSERQAHNIQVFEQLASVITVKPMDQETATIYGRIRAELERTGRKIGALDTMIAAHALTLKFVLVTNNTRDFSRIRGLKLENWLA